MIMLVFVMWSVEAYVLLVNTYDVNTYDVNTYDVNTCDVNAYESVWARCKCQNFYNLDDKLNRNFNPKSDQKTPNQTFHLSSSTGTTS